MLIFSQMTQIAQRKLRLMARVVLSVDWQSTFSEGPEDVMLS
jgi:hypothetical protein